VAGLSLFLLVVVGTLTWVAVRPDTYTADPGPRTTTPSVGPALAARTVHDLEDAVVARDPEAAAALAPTGDAATARLLSAVVENAQDLHVRDFTLRYVDETGAMGVIGDWQAAVDVTWQFAGFDRAPARAEVRFGFVADGDRVALVSMGGGDRRTPLWLTGPLQVRRSRTTLVLATNRADADRYAARARAAVPVVRKVITDWRPRLVVEVPGSVGVLDRALAAEPGTYDNIAAVTTSVDGTLAPSSPIHVFVNPDVFNRLRPAGGQVVMSHEATHVATDAASSVLPLWLVEGFADYVALRDVELPITTTAGQIIEQVRRHGPPPELPGVGEFDTTASHLGAAYESAWLACRVLADRGGESALVRLYRQVDGGQALGRALASGFGWTEGQLTRSWRARLAHLAG
jgi:hypothetical protein